MRSLASFAVFALAAPLAAEPFLVADLNTGPNIEQAQVRLPSAADGNVAYFSASDPAHGLELWRTDGTPGGTWRVTDVCPGRCLDLQLSVPHRSLERHPVHRVAGRRADPFGRHAGRDLPHREALLGL
ncbi:MAG TPA: hypothetical protein VKM72_21990 [Thermoanaerobaculia bacterium]|nr:hypothetical protein [Thermoanaerobaculia bacterium]